VQALEKEVAGLQSKLSEAQSRQQERLLKEEQAHSAVRDKDFEITQLRYAKRALCQP